MRALEIDLEPLAARDARLAHPPGDDGRMRGHPTLGCQDAARLDQTVDVVRGRLPADQNHVFAGPAALVGRIGVEHDSAGRCAGRGVESARRDLVRRVGVDPRVQELVELGGVDPRHRLLARDQTLRDHVHRDAQRGGSRALSRPRLQQVQPSVLDGELDVLHLAVVLLEPANRVGQLGKCAREAIAHPLDRLGRADPGDDVLALGVEQELAPEAWLTRRGVAREQDAGAGRVPLVAEDHLDDVDGGAQIVGDPVGASVHLRPRRLPRVEHGPHGPLQLRPRVLREGSTGALAVHGLETADELLEVLRRQVDVLNRVARLLEPRQLLLEQAPLDSVDDLAVHLDQAAVGVEGEPPVSGRRREALDRVVVQTEVQDRVHHPGHRDRRAGAHRDQQRVGAIPEALGGALLERDQTRADLVLQSVGERPACLHVVGARLGRDDESVRDRDPDRHHLRQPEAFAAEQLTTNFRAYGEVVDVCAGRGLRLPHGGEA